MKLTPVRGLLLVLLVIGGLVGAQQFTGARRGHPGYTRVSPDAKGNIVIDASAIAPLGVQFFRFLNSGNQEVLFFIARDEHGGLQVAFDAGESHYKLHRGFRIQDGWVTDNKCDSTIRVSEINNGGSGCRPAPLKHEVVGSEVRLRDQDILAGWRFFN